MATTTRMPAGESTKGAVIADVTYGKANYETSCTSYSCMKVTAPFSQSSAANSGRVITGSGSWSRAGRLGSNGGFKHERVEHKNGTILLVRGTKTLNGMPYSEAALFLRLRDTGPMYEVYGRLPASTQNVIGDEVRLICARADMMTLDDLKVAGIEVPMNFRKRFLQGEEIAEMLTAAQIQPEISKRPQLVAVATDNGVEVKEISAEPTRRMRFRSR